MIRKTASDMLTAFLRTKEKSAIVGTDEINALSGFLKHLGLHPLQLVRGE